MSQRTQPRVGVIGAGGIEKILELKLNAEEQAMMDKSVKAVRELVGSMK